MIIICSIGRRLIIIHQLRNRTGREILRGTCTMYARYTNILLRYRIIHIVRIITNAPIYILLYSISGGGRNFMEIKNLTCIMRILYYRCIHIYIQLLNCHKIEARHNMMGIYIVEAYIMDSLVLSDGFSIIVKI